MSPHGVRSAVDRENTLIIIPAYNEEEALPGVLDELAAEVPSFDVLVVVDGATDDTAAIARAAGARVLELPYNLGIGGALRTGFRYAVEYGYSRAVQFDADGQHDSTQIKRLLDALDDGADMVVGTRFSAAATNYDIGRTRHRAMGVLRLVLKALSGRRFTDTSSGFRAFNRKVVQYFARTYPVEYMDSVEALLLACYAGFRVDEVPVSMRARSGGVPSNRSIKLLYHYVRLMIVMLASASLRSRWSRGAT